MRIANILVDDIQAHKMYYNEEIVWRRQPYKVEVEALIATTQQMYIITDIILNNIDGMEFEIIGKVGPGGATTLFGVRNEVDPDSINMTNQFDILASSDGRYKFRIKANSNKREQVILTNIVNSPTDFKINYVNGVKEIIVDNQYIPPQLTEKAYPWKPFNIASPLALFGNNSNDVVVDNMAQPRQINYFKLALQGELVAEYIPVLDYDDVPCFYDKVKDTLVYSSGSDTFQYI